MGSKRHGAGEGDGESEQLDNLRGGACKNDHDQQRGRSGHVNEALGRVQHYSGDGERVCCEFSQHEDYGQQGKYREHGEGQHYENWRQHRRKRPRRVTKPLVDLSKYDPFSVSTLHEPLFFHLPCEIVDAKGQGAAAMVDSLRLSVTEVSQAPTATGAMDMNLQSLLLKDKCTHGCRNKQTHAQGPQDDHECTPCEKKLMDCKLKIMAARLKYGADVWSLAAQLVNPYETLPSVAVRVLNRAFFKMWELMQLFPGLMAPVTKMPKLLSAHLCEGPGGFVQALHMHRLWNTVSEKGSRTGSPSSVIDYSSGKKESGDAWFAMTLATPDGQSNALKMQMSKLQESLSNSVIGHVHYGADQSGDVTNPNNISSFVQYVLQKTGGEKMHLITGDGAFDVSDDFSSQEQSHSHLFFCEILIASRLQCPGGAFVLKLFDCFTETTATLLHILAALYTTVEIVRLRTSRVCNSERYVVAQGFRFLPVSLEDKLMSISTTWYQSARDGNSATINISKPFPASFVEALNQGNAAIASEQILSIQGAVSVAEDLGERLLITNISHHKGILSILRRKLRTIEKLQKNALSLCESLSIPLAMSMK